MAASPTYTLPHAAPVCCPGTDPPLMAQVHRQETHPVQGCMCKWRVASLEHHLPHDLLLVENTCTSEKTVVFLLASNCCCRRQGIASAGAGGVPHLYIICRVLYW
jgi:hypothetical protein